MRAEPLKRGLQLFAEHGATDGRRRASLRLEAGDFLVLCNDRITHAREHYRNSSEGFRHLVRALYTVRLPMARTRSAMHEA